MTPDQRLEYRNDIVAAILMASEKNCEVYLEYLHGNQVAVRAFSSVFATLFSGAAAVTTPAATARALAALGSASSGVGGNIDQAAFSKLAVETIAAGVRADQAEGVLDLRAKLSGSAYRDWPLALAIRDALEIHNRCDAVSALGYLQGTALQKADVANKTATPPPAGAVTTAPAGGVK